MVIDAIIFGTWPAVRSIIIASIFIEPVDPRIQGSLQMLDIGMRQVYCSLAPMFVGLTGFLAWVFCRIAAMSDKNCTMKEEDRDV